MTSLFFKEEENEEILRIEIRVWDGLPEEAWNITAVRLKLMGMGGVEMVPEPSFSPFPFGNIFSKCMPHYIMQLLFFSVTQDSDS